MAPHRVVMPGSLTASSLRERVRENRRMHREPPPRTVRGSHMNRLRRLAGLPRIWSIPGPLPTWHGGAAGEGDGPAGTAEPRRPRRPSPALGAEAEPPEDPSVDMDAVGRAEPPP